MAIIGFDARSVRTTTTGLGRTAHCLLKKIAELDTTNNYVVFQRRELLDPLVKQDRFQTIHMDYDIASLQNLFLFAGILKKSNLDLYHSLNAFLPFALPVGLKSIVTVHDFNWIQRPALAAPKPWQGYCNGLYGRVAHTYAVARAHHIVCISDQTRKELTDLYPNVPSIVSTIHHGYELNEVKEAEIDSCIRGLEKRRYILSVGNGRPYKNPEGTVKAFIKLKSKPGYEDVLLVMAGRGDSTPTLQKIAEASGVRESVFFLGLVADSELRFLYQNAQFLSFPSRWEGFGLPVIEAFASGCPVLASCAGSLPEICNGSAFVIQNPESLEEISNAFDILLCNASLRSQLKYRGLQRVKDFSWEKTTTQYLNIYEKMLG